MNDPYFTFCLNEPMLVHLENYDDPNCEAMKQVTTVVIIIFVEKQYLVCGVSLP